MVGRWRRSVKFIDRLELEVSVPGQTAFISGAASEVECQKAAID